MLVYIEYRSRNRGVDLATFHKIVGRRQSTWSDEHADDRLVLNIGRTWRLGPEPEYLTIYYTPNAGLERLGEWERIFTSGEADHLEAQTRAVCRLDFASCLEPLLEPVPGTSGPYYAEYLDFAPDATRADVTALFERRRDAHRDLTLHLVADRIGKLGLEPRCLAVWGLPDYGALDGVARELDGVSEPVRLVNAGLYHDVGREIL